MSETAAAAPAAAPSAPAAAPNANPATDAAAPKSPPNPGGETAAQQRQRVALADMPDDTEFVLRVNGADVVVTAAEARRKLQSDEASTKRWEEAARMRREVEAQRKAISEALTDPRRFREELAELGYSPGEIARAVLQAELEEQNMTPEQRRLRELEREQRKWEAERQAAQEAELQRTTEQHRAVYERAFASAADLAGVPKSARVRQVVQSALVEAVGKAIQIGASLDMPQLTSIARQAYQEHAADYRSALTVEERRALITDEDIAWYAEQRKARAKPAAVEGTPAAPARDLPPRDDAGRFRADDAAGRRVIRSVRDVLGSSWTARR